MARRGTGGRRKKRGRPKRRAKAAARRRGLTVKQKAHFVFKHRHLIVKRRENFTKSDRADLITMLEYLPELAVLRRFADRMYWLFDSPKDFHQASCRRAARSCGIRRSRRCRNWSRRWSSGSQRSSPRSWRT